MIRVCFYSKCDLHKNVLNTKPFSRYIFGLRYWDKNFDISLICNVFSNVFKFKGKQAGSCIGCEGFLEVRIGQLRSRQVKIGTRQVQNRSRQVKISEDKSREIKRDQDRSRQFSQGQDRSNQVKIRLKVHIGQIRSKFS